MKRAVAGWVTTHAPAASPWAVGEADAAGAADVALPADAQAQATASNSACPMRDRGAVPMFGSPVVGGVSSGASREPTRATAGIRDEVGALVEAVLSFIGALAGSDGERRCGPVQLLGYALPALAATTLRWRG